MDEDVLNFKEKLEFYMESGFDRDVCIQMFLILELQELNKRLYAIELNFRDLVRK